MISKNIYCVYHITYFGNNLPPKYNNDLTIPSNYIGSTSVEKVKFGYMGSIKSKQYKKIWKSELKDHPELFQIEIVSYHDDRADATWKELQLQQIFNVVKNPLFINMAYAQPNGYFGSPQTGVKTGMALYKNVENGSIKYMKTSDILVTSKKYVGVAAGNKRPDHSEYMKSIGFGKNKTQQHLDNHRKSWIESTRDNPIRAKTWNIYRMGMVFQIKNLRKFCLDNNIKYRTFYDCTEINGYRLLK